MKTSYQSLMMIARNTGIMFFALMLILATPLQAQTGEEFYSIAENVRRIATLSQRIESVVIAEYEKSISEHLKKVQNELPQERGRIVRLNALIEPERKVYISHLKTVLRDVPELSQTTIAALGKTAQQNIDIVNTKIENATGVSYDTSNHKQAISVHINTFMTEVTTSLKAFSDTQADLLYKDSDYDDVSDYDEVKVYGTDPLKAYTAGGDQTDGEKILQGLNPLSKDAAPIAFQDAKTQGKVVTGVYTVATAEYATSTSQEKNIVFKGTGLPNSYVTIYVYSTQHVGVTKTDEAGNWVYELKHQIEDGFHTLFAATVSADGEIISKGEPITFEKTAKSILLSFAGLHEGSLEDRSNRFKRNIIPLTIGTLAIGAFFVYYLSRLNKRA